MLPACRRWTPWVLTVPRRKGGAPFASSSLHALETLDAWTHPGHHLSAPCLQALDTLDAWTLAQARPNQQQPQAEGSRAAGITAADGSASSNDLGGGGCVR